MQVSALPAAPAMPRGAEALGAYWHEEDAQKATAFFPQYLRHTEGEWAGRPFVLADWQRDDIIRPIWGWKRADGTRLIRVVWIEVPRKNGKTELAAGVSLLALLGDGEKGGQGYSLAVNKKQAEIVFRKAGSMVAMSDMLRKHVEIFKTSIYVPELNASFKPLSGGPHGKHGLSTSVSVGDEVHEWTDGELADVVHKSTAARSQPLELFITTGGVVGQGYAYDMHQLAEQLISGEVIDPTMHAVIYAAPADADIRSEATWRKANPNYGISVKPDYMAKEAEKAARSPREENNFRRYHLNQWTEQVTRWLPMGADGWKGCTTTPADAMLWHKLFEKMKGRRCFSAVDIGITKDLSALCHCFPPEGDETRFTFLWRFWLPKETALDQPISRKVRYESFANAGALSLTPGNITDFAFLEAAIVSDCAAFNVQWLGFDPYNAADLMVRLAEQHGLPVQQMRQGYLSMSGPAKGFERLVMGHLLEHGSNPVATWMARNAVIETDPAGNIKPDKGKAADKIDGIVAAVMAYAGANAHMSKFDKPSIYETRGLVLVG